MNQPDPRFWWTPPGLKSWALWPASLIYQHFARKPLTRPASSSAKAPVLCVGNFVVGGTGKTPTSICLAHAAKNLGFNPGFLSRGYGGKIRKAHLVDLEKDTAQAVGDEPVLLAKLAPTAIDPGRKMGAELLVEAGVDFIIMDDGFQSRRLKYDYALMLVDAARAIGNGFVLPAGPLRAPLNDQLRHTSAVMRMGKGDSASQVVRAAAKAAKPIYSGRLQNKPFPLPANNRFLAFAGIGNPDRFFDSCLSAGIVLIDMQPFPDHHNYKDNEIKALQDRAKSENLHLVTTAKDVARLTGASALADEFVQQLNILEVTADIHPPGTAEQIIRQTRENFNALNQPAARA